MQKLFSEFNSVTASQWKERLVKDLKGVDFNQLIWHTDNQIDVLPFYTQEDVRAVSPAPLYFHSNWDIGVKVLVDDVITANKAALEALSCGASSLSFYIIGNINLELLLKDIQIECISMQFYINDDALGFKQQLSTIIANRNLQDHSLDIVIGNDVIARLVKNGNWIKNRNEDFEVITQIANLPINKHKLLIDADIYQNTGVNQVTELALILSHYNEYLNYLSDLKFDFEKFKNGIQFNISVGSDFFGEIAKLKALQKLIPLINASYQFSAPVIIHCTTSLLTSSPIDEHTNLLRSTTQAMSSIVGGCHTLFVELFNALSKNENENKLATRLAINQQIILKEESYLNKVADISAGSYYIETLSEQIAKAAFDLFKEYESKGGFIALLENGSIQQEIERQANVLIEKVKSGELVIIGVNKYVNPKEQPTQQSAKSSQKIPSNGIKPLQPLNLSLKYEPSSNLVNS